MILYYFNYMIHYYFIYHKKYMNFNVFHHLKLMALIQHPSLFTSIHHPSVLRGTIPWHSFMFVELETTMS